MINPFRILELGRNIIKVSALPKCPDLKSNQKEPYSTRIRVEVHRPVNSRRSIRISCCPERTKRIKERNVENACAPAAVKAISSDLSATCHALGSGELVVVLV